MRDTHKIASRHWKVILSATLLLGGATFGWAQEPPPPQPPPQGTSSEVASSTLSASELAKEISNPVTSIWQLQFQFNNVKLETDELSPVSGEWVYNLYFQPVMPVSR